MARRKVRPGPLEDRSAAILRAIIEEYVATAQPVGSVALVEKYALSISPATVRNIMAELETAELLGHPHTSAGRVPTDRGYRLYVESIADSVSLAPVEQLMIRHQFGQVEFANEQWFRLAASTLASADRARRPSPRPSSRRPAASVASTSCPPPSASASLLLVMADGPVKQVLLNLDREYTGGRTRRDRARRRPRAAGQDDRRRSTPCSTRCASVPASVDALFTQAVERVVAGHARVRRRCGRGGLQRGPAQRHGGARVRALRAAAPRLQRAAGPRLPGRARAAARRPATTSASSSAARTSTRR